MMCKLFSDSAIAVVVEEEVKQVFSGVSSFMQIRQLTISISLEKEYTVSLLRLQNFQNHFISKDMF